MCQGEVLWLSALLLQKSSSKFTQYVPHAAVLGNLRDDKETQSLDLQGNPWREQASLSIYMYPCSSSRFTLTDDIKPTW